MLDRTVSRPILARWLGSASHSVILHDESVAFALEMAIPGTDHAPVNSLTLTRSTDTNVG